MDVKKYYNYLGEKYLDSYRAQGMEIISKNEINFVLSNLPSRKNKINVLEIGTGPGRISKEVVKKNVRFTGVDISEEMVNRCKEKLKRFRFVNILKCDISKGLSFRDEAFDFIYAIRVLKYVNNLGYVLNEINRVLKRDGIFVFSMPNKYSINRANVFHKLPYNRVSKSELLKILRKNNFSINRIEYGPKLPDILYKTSNKFLLKIILWTEQLLKILFGSAFSRFLYVSAKK
ncbi:MAG: class I SAM-dependent methyltransferase [Candidatus Aenigmatarchaeota archaeon]